MKVQLVLVLLAAALCFVCATQQRPGEVYQKFRDFQTRFGKSYATQEEYHERFLIFAHNLDVIEELNNRKNGATYGITQFTDMTKQEFTTQVLMASPPPLDKKHSVAPLVNATAPSSFNWVGHNPPVVTPVYNQGQCGSCWAFSATENIESRWALKGHPLVSLAMQQIVDCDTTDGGCNGGWPYNAYQYVINAGGMDPLADYPYVAENEACRFNPSEVVAKITSWQYVTQSQNEQQMANYLYANGPLSVCVDASEWSFYTSGIFSASECGTSIDHCVLATGYNIPGGYWIIRNSWGTSWGMSGYMYLQYGADACAVAQVVTSSVSA